MSLRRMSLSVVASTLTLVILMPIGLSAESTKPTLMPSGSSSAPATSRAKLRLQKRMEAQKKRLERSKKSSTKEVVGTGFTMYGDELSPVTIVEFGDYQCPFCAHFHHDVFKQIQYKYWDGNRSKVRFVFRNVPLDFHQNAMDLARVVECSREDVETDAEQLATKIFKEQYLSGNSVTLENVYAWIEKGMGGMDSSLIRACVESRKRDGQIQGDIAAANALGVTGTPYFIIIGPSGSKRVVQGAQVFEAFRTAIDAALQEK